MADQIQLPGPIAPPQGQPPAPPYDMVNAQINRAQQNAQAFPNALNQVVDDYYKKQQMKAAAFEAGGPYLMNKLYGGGQPPQQSAGAPSGWVSGQQVATQPPNGSVGKSPTDDNQESLSPSDNSGLATGWQTQQPAGQPQMATHPESGLPQNIHDHMESVGITDPQDQAAHLDAHGIPHTMGIDANGLNQDQRNLLNQYGVTSPGELATMGKTGAALITSLRTLGELGLQPGAMMKQNQDLQAGDLDIGNKKFMQTQQPIIAAKNKQELINSQSQIPFETGRGSADQQNKYATPEIKIQTASTKLQALYNAYSSVPDALKGAGIGLATGKAGSSAGKLAPELVTYNKLRESVATSLAIAKNPENPRPSPQDIQDELKNLPSVSDDPKVASNLFKLAGEDLKNAHSLNTRTYQSSAQAFGGNIKPENAPNFNFGSTQYQKVMKNSKTGESVGWDGSKWVPIQ